jgi:hypothetical protein
MSHRLCLDVKTNRVIYYTDDPAYSIPADSNNYLLAEVEQLPVEMTLRTCWQWRFKSGELLRETVAGKPAAPVKTLLEQNKASLRKQLQTELLQKWAIDLPWAMAALPQERIAATAQEFLTAERLLVSQINAAASQADIDIAAISIKNIIIRHQ